MYIDTINGLTHLTAHGGHVLVCGGKIVKEIWLTQGESSRDWQEVSDLVLLTPQEQQQRVDELEQKNAELENQVTDYENKWNNLDAVKARFNVLGKVVKETLPVGDFLNPIPFEESIEVEQGKFYSVDDPENPNEPFVWEAKKTGIPMNGQDTEYFDIV